jgi:hypothetical protein
MTPNEVLRVEDLKSVGTRVSWGAICAGGMIALGMYFLLTTLAGAVGWSVTEHVQPANLQTAAIVWAFVTTIVALFVGGLVTSLLTAGEDKIEAVLYGVVMWALLVTAFLVLGAVGVRSGFHSMTVMANNSQRGSVVQWEAGAREAGVPATQIDEWRRKANDPETQKLAADASARLTWYAFAGTWLSMIAAAAGAWVGAGPTFRVVIIRPTQSVIAA